jgi:uncharacterized protein YjbI with pentapeptide repeats
VEEVVRDMINNIRASIGQAISTIRLALIPRGLSKKHVVWGIRIVTPLAVVVGILGLLVHHGFVTSENATLIGALIALTGVVTSQVVNTLIAQSYQAKQQELETRRAQAQQELETRRAQAYRFQAYLAQMEKLLIDHQLRKSNKATSEDSDEAHEARVVAQAETLAVLEGESDPTRKRILLLFLYDSALIDNGKPIITLARANLSSVDMTEARLKSANLTEADLSKANLSAANLLAANLSKANLSAANMTEAYLREASLRDVDLTDANLRGAYLLAADLTEANLSGANLSKANFSAAHLSAAHLLAADLTDVNLRGAYLLAADLADANLSGANLLAADLRRAKNLTQEQINLAYGDEHTKLPDDLQRPAHWSKGDEEASEEDEGGEKR